MASIQGFDEAYYLQEKLQSLQSNPNFGNITTTEQLKAVIEQSGMTPELHYKKYGSSENINISPYFNKVEYLESKLLALREDPVTAADWKGKSVGDLEVFMADLGLTPAEHYYRYGFSETRADGTLLNPSNAFDANAYFAAKLKELQKTNPGEFNKASVVDVVKMFQEAQIDPVTHYMTYGASEAQLSKVNMVQTVPTVQRVPEDPDRAVQGTFVPGNSAKPTPAPAENKAGAVPKPGDMGGYHPDTQIPPAKEPVPTPEIPGLNAPETPDPPAQPETPETPIVPENPDNAGNGKPDKPGGKPDNPGGGKPDNPGGKPDKPGGGDNPGTEEPENPGGGDPDNPGTDPDNPGTEEPGDPEDPIQPVPTAILTKADAVMTPLTYKNAPRTTGHNQDDVVEIATAEALNAELDGGTRTDSQPENDTLILSTGTVGVPWRDTQGFIRHDPYRPLNAINFETLILGEGAQQVELANISSDNKFPVNITFDHVDDYIFRNRFDLKSISNNGEGQGTIQSYYFDFSDTEWNVQGKIALLSVNGYTDIHIDQDGLQNISCNNISILHMKNKATSVNGKVSLQDENIAGISTIRFEEMTFDEETRVLEGAFDANISMYAAQWTQLEKLNRLKNFKDYTWLSLKGDDDSTVNAKALTNLLEKEAVGTYNTLLLNEFSNIDLETVDFSQSNFSVVELDRTTTTALVGKKIIGHAGQTIRSIADKDTPVQCLLDTLGNMQGFDNLFLSNGGVERADYTLTLNENSSLRSIDLGGGLGNRTEVHDKSTVENTLKIGSSGKDPAIFSISGIEHLEMDDNIGLDVSTLTSDCGLKTISGNGILVLHGELTDDALEALQSTEIIKGVGLGFHNVTRTSPFALDMHNVNVSTISLSKAQLPLATICNVSTVQVYGDDITTADIAKSKCTSGAEGTNDIPAYILTATGDIDMSTYAHTLTLKADKGTILGGDGGNTINSKGNQTGGSGTDNMTISTCGGEVQTVQNGKGGDDKLEGNISENNSQLIQSGGSGNDHLSGRISGYYLRSTSLTQNGDDGEDLLEVNIIYDAESNTVLQDGGTGNDELYVDTSGCNDTITQRGGTGDDTVSAKIGGTAGNTLTQEGGEGNDTLYVKAESSDNTVTQDGGEGNDTLELLVVSLVKGGSFSLTGGAGKDSFKISHDLDFVQSALDDTSTSPYVLATIADFGSGVSGQRETIDVSEICYSEIPAPDATTRVKAYFFRKDFMGTAKTNKVDTLDDALNAVARKTITEGKIGVFDFNGDTYLFGNNAHDAVDKGDLLIKLTGISANSVTAENFVFHQ